MGADAPEALPAVEVRAVAEIGDPRGVGVGVRGGGRLAGPLWAEGAVDVLARPPLSPRVVVAPDLRLYAGDPRAGRAAVSVALGGGLDVRLDPLAGAVVAPHLFGEASLDVHVQAPWSVRVSAGYASDLAGSGAATLGLGLLWMRPARAPEPVAEPQSWLPYPMCAWASQDVAERTLAALEASRPPLPGARVVVDPEAPPALGALVVIAYAGDVVRWQGADLPVDDQGVRELAVELDVDDAVLEVVGGGRAQELPVVALSDRVTWLRAEAPEVRRVMFGLDSSELDPLARLALEELASRTGEWSWEVHGSASPEGRVDDNRALAEARAGAVRDALIQLGLPAERVVVGDLDAPDPGLPPEEQRAVRLVPVRRGER